MSEPLCLTSTCGQLRVRFFADDDRRGHVIECRVGDAFVPLLRSVEGTADQAWPPSSPLQDVRPCDGADGQPCLLGTGMAGRSFWSLSITPVAQALAFDHACRSPATVTPDARATYQPQRPWVQATDEGIVWNDPDITLRLVPFATPSSDPPTIEIADRRLSLSPVLHQENSTSGRAVRWAFRIELDLA